MIVACLGEKGLAQELGKKGTQSDMAFYNHADSSGLVSFVEPISYPDRIAPMLYAAYMGDVILFNLNAASFSMGFAETVMALDYLGKGSGIFVLDGVVEEQVKALVKGTCLEGYTFMEKNPAAVMGAVKAFPLPQDGSGLAVAVDHIFSPKSVGTVILGGVKKGSVKKYDTVKLFPQKKEITVKSIQVNDKEVNEAGQYSRVGLSLKGADASELSRGDFITKGDVALAKEIPVKFEKCKFYQKELPRKAMCLIGLQYVEADFDGAKLSFAKDVALYEAKLILCDPSNKVRILGKATY